MFDFDIDEKLEKIREKKSKIPKERLREVYDEILARSKKLRPRVRHGFLVNYIFCISDKRSFEEFEKLIDDREKHLREVCQHLASDKTYTSILYKIIITEDDVRFLKSRLQ